MPELPEVETTRRGLHAAVAGKKILSVTLHRSAIRTPIPPHFVQHVSHTRIKDVRRRAKYLLLDLDSGDSILAHLGMSGSFTVVPKNDFMLKKHDHVVVELEGGLLMVFNDPRRFGVIDLLEAGQEKNHPMLRNLGPEPLENAFSPEYLKAQLLRRKGPIKPVIMDQKLVVGVGNIYASESLHLCGINPLLPANKIANQAAELIAAIRTTLEAAIRSGGSTLRNYVGATNEAGYFQHHFHVYDHAGDLCTTCAAPIQFVMQAGRATYWCNVCQPISKKRLKS
jgi:formamidopyrimidine-DNA glycosylase